MQHDQGFVKLERRYMGQEPKCRLPYPSGIDTLLRMVRSFYKAGDNYSINEKSINRSKVAGMTILPDLSIMPQESPCFTLA